MGVCADRSAVRGVDGGVGSVIEPKMLGEQGRVAGRRGRGHCRSCSSGSDAVDVHRKRRLSFTAAKPRPLTAKECSCGLGEWRRRTTIDQALRGAELRGELHLHWQPQLDIAGWRIHAAEALARWQHPTLCDVSPAEFIPAAEESGYIRRSSSCCARPVATACRVAWSRGRCPCSNSSAGAQTGTRTRCR